MISIREVSWNHFWIAFVISLLIWFGMMWLFRKQNFGYDGQRKADKPLPTTNDAEIESQIKARGENIYKDLDLFFKISFALFLGISTILLSDAPQKKHDLSIALVNWSLNVQLFSALFTAAFVITHKHAITLRWKRSYRMIEVFGWGETWGYIAGMGITLNAYYVSGPALVNLALR